MVFNDISRLTIDILWFVRIIMISFSITPWNFVNIFEETPKFHMKVRFLPRKMTFSSQLGKHLWLRFKRYLSIYHPRSDLLSLLGFNISLFSCDFGTQGSRAFCGWKDAPRDNGVTWSIIKDSNLETNILCLSSSELKRSSIEEGFDDDDSFDFRDKKETFIKAKLWSQIYRTAKGEFTPQCVKFLFKFEPVDIEELFTSNLMLHSSRWWLVYWNTFL